MEPVYSGINGFLGTRASIMLDVVFVAMFALIPLMGWSIAAVKYRRNYEFHKKLQLVLGVVLLITVVLFELDLQLITKWRDRAAASPYYDTWVFPSLYLHLFFAVPTLLLWVYVIVDSVRKFATPPRPNAYSHRHKKLGKLAAIEMTLTALTGWVFYWLAFVS